MFFEIPLFMILFKCLNFYSYMFITELLENIGK